MRNGFSRESFQEWIFSIAFEYTTFICTVNRHFELIFDVFLVLTMLCVSVFTKPLFLGSIRTKTLPRGGKGVVCKGRGSFFVLD